MKKLALATAFSITATSVLAGGYTPPVYEQPLTPVVIVEENTSSSAGGVLVPLLALILIAAAIAAD